LRQGGFELGAKAGWERGEEIVVGLGVLSVSRWRPWLFVWRKNCPRRKQERWTLLILCYEGGLVTFPVSPRNKRLLHTETGVLSRIGRVLRNRGPPSLISVSEGGPKSGKLSRRPSISLNGLREDVFIQLKCSQTVQFLRELQTCWKTILETNKLALA